MLAEDEEGLGLCGKGKGSRVPEGAGGAAVWWDDTSRRFWKDGMVRRGGVCCAGFVPRTRLAAEEKDTCPETTCGPNRGTRRRRLCGLVVSRLGDRKSVV